MNTKPNPHHIDDTIWRSLPQVQKTPGSAAPAAGRAGTSAANPVHTQPRPRKSSARGPLVFILFGLLACAVFAFAAVSAAATPAVASILQYAAGPTATEPVYSAQSNIIKPTFTPTPLPTFTPTIPPSPMPTETPGVAEASIVVDTPTPEYADVQPPSAAPASSGDKYILVSISEQHMYVYEGGNLIWSFVASTGMNNATRTGLFHVQDKIPNAYGATWNIWMPNWLGIYYAGSLENGIHALPILPNGSRLWAGWLGTPISYGCVVLGVQESEELYNWAEVGTPVEIRW